MFGSELIVATIAVVVFCLWARRGTWHYPWETAITAAVLLLAVGLVLACPSQQFVGSLLHLLTGEPHLDDYLSHLCFMGSVACLIFGLAARLGVARRVMRKIQLPGQLAAVAMLIALTNSDTVEQAWVADFFEVPCDKCLTTYWCIYCGALLYLLANLAGLVWQLWRSQRSYGNLLIMASGVGCGIVGTLVRWASVWWPSSSANRWAWWLLCWSAGLFAFAAARSWRARITRLESLVDDVVCEAAHGRLRDNRKWGD